ncbi:MAG: MCE family protein [Bacteroidales bacterium]|nr:MCE family protein [Bacteroidales bacterium]
MKLSRELKIGIVAIITIALLIWGMNYLKGINVFKSSDYYYSTYENIDGLIESGVIYLRGFRIGNVSGIEFDKQGNGDIIVKYNIKEKIEIPRNSVFEIYSSSIVSGTKDVRLLLAVNDTVYESGDTVPGRLDRGLSAIIDPVKDQALLAVSRLDSLLASLNMLVNEQSAALFHTTLEHAGNVAGSLDRSLAPGGSLKASLDNLASVTENLKKSNAELKMIMVNFATVSDSVASSDLKSAIDNASITLQNSAQILTKVDNGEGSLGLLVNNDSLYNNLKSVSESLDLLLKDLRDHPKRYVHFSLFGKKDKEKENN